MRLLRGLAGTVLWLLAGVVCLVGVLLCVTIILLPLGVVVLRLGRRLFSAALALFLPKAARHPVSAAGDKARELAGGASSAIRDNAPDPGKLRKRARKSRKTLSHRLGW